MVDFSDRRIQVGIIVVVVICIIIAFITLRKSNEILEKTEKPEPEPESIFADLEKLIEEHGVNDEKVKPESIPFIPDSTPF